MFWKKKSDDGTVEKGPQNVPVIVQQHLINENKVDPDFAPLLKAVIRKNGEGGYFIRLFDESDAAAKKVVVKNYTSLDEHPDIVIYEGTCDEGAKKVKLAEKNKFNWNTPISNEAEVLSKIEGLTQPGSNVFFYQARGANNGGPLGKGCNIIELNPQYPGKGQKKYNIFTADVVGTQPVDKGQRLWNSDKPKEIAKWVVQGHHKRLYS
jgi:hypothetical protein